MEIQCTKFPSCLNIPLVKLKGISCILNHWISLQLILSQERKWDLNERVLYTLAGIKAPSTRALNLFYSEKVWKTNCFKSGWQEGLSVLENNGVIWSLLSSFLTWIKLYFLCWHSITSCFNQVWGYSSLIEIQGWDLKRWPLISPFEC